MKILKNVSENLIQSRFPNTAILICRSRKWLICLLLSFLISACDILNGPAGTVTENDFKQFLKKRHFDIYETDTRIPDLEYQLINGQKENFTANKGNVVLLNFWTTWCYPCKQEMPDLEELKHKMKGEKFRILAVNSGEDSEKITRFLTKYPYSFDIILDENKDFSDSMNIEGLPTTFIFDRNLKLIGRLIGIIDWKDEAFISYLTRYSRT